MQRCTLINGAWRAGLRVVACGVWLLYGCDTTAPNTEFRKSLPPIPLDFTLSVRSASGTDGVDLVVTAVVRNTRPSSVTILTGATCAPYLALFPNPSGEYQSHVTPAMQCPSTSPSTTLSPGDSISLVNRVTAPELLRLPPGKYGIDAAITTTAEMFGRSAGNVDLPLHVP